MKYAIIVISSLLLALGSCRQTGNTGKQDTLTAEDSLQISGKLNTAIQAEIKKVFPADSMQFEITALHFKRVNQAFIDTYIISQARVYHTMYTQKSNRCIDASLGNKDSAEIYNAMAARYLDTVRLYKKLGDILRKNPPATYKPEFYYTEFQFLPIINGTARQNLNSVAVMFFNKNFVMIEASAPKLLAGVVIEQ